MINALDFLNRILFNDSKMKQSLNDFSHVDTDGPIEINQFAFEVEAELQSQQLQNVGNVPPRMDPYVLIEQMPSTSQAIQNESHTPPPRDGMCIVCMSSVANVLYFDCRHMALCETCHTKLKRTHIENCHRWYGDNERKLNRELNNIRCPKCNVPYKKADIIFINSFN